MRAKVDPEKIEFWKVHIHLLDDRFTPGQRLAVRLRYGLDEHQDPMALSAIGQQLPNKVSTSRVQHIIEAAEKKLQLILNPRTPDFPTYPAVQAADVPTLERWIDELGFNPRLYCILRRASISIIGDLVSLSAEELGHIPNFGKKSTDEVRLRLKQYERGPLYLKGENPDEVQVSNEGPA